jgi:hypothetical protein
LESELQEKEELRLKKLKEQEFATEGDYRIRMREKLIEKQIISDLYRSKKVCEGLDRAQVNTWIYKR